MRNRTYEKGKVLTLNVHSVIYIHKLCAIDYIEYMRVFMQETCRIIIHSSNKI